jgi:cytochrome c oxidase subunit III
MAIGLIFLSLLMATIVWWLFRQTVNVQPWQAQAAAPDVRGDASKWTRPAIKTALWSFLAVATSLFALFLSAYATRLGLADWTPLPRPRLLMVNTAVLVGASLAMQWAVHAARNGDAATMLRGLSAGGLLSLVFVAGQLVVWKQLHDAGFAVASGAAADFFYLLTAVHGLHVLGGVVAWVRASRRAWRDPAPARTTLAIELCATYWHYLLAVWLVLYALLVSNALGLAICSSTPL